MKALIMSLALIAAVTAQAGEVLRSTQEKIAPDSVDQLIKLVDKDEPGSSQKKVNIVVTDGGMSTDVSPRYSVYLGLSSMAEMGNLSATIKITDQAFQFVSASRKSAGQYEVKIIEYRDEGMVEVTKNIDATQMFIDERSQRESCNAEGGFCDGTLSTSATVSESTRPAN